VIEEVGADGLDWGDHLQQAGDFDGVLTIGAGHNDRRPH
jgi:hypothetical protein